MIVAIATFWLPTDKHIRKPKFCIPEQGRVYSCDLYKGANGEALTYEEIRVQHNASGIPFSWTGSLDELVAIEFWIDGGTSRHTSYFMNGYLYVWFKQTKAMEDEDFWEISNAASGAIQEEK